MVHGQVPSTTDSNTIVLVLSNAVRPLEHLYVPHDALYTWKTSLGSSHRSCVDSTEKLDMERVGDAG